MTDTLVIIGFGMVGHRLVEAVRAGDRPGRWRIVVLGEEPHPAYDRTALSAYLLGRSGSELSLVSDALWHDPLVQLRPGTSAVTVDRVRRVVVTGDGAEIGYDALVLATGARPFVPLVPGHDRPGCLVYRTIEDMDALRAEARSGHPAVVVGGGLLGLEAAGALRELGLRPHVVEAAPQLMPAQLDPGGARVLARRVTASGLRLHCGTGLHTVNEGVRGRVGGVTLAGGARLPAGIVVFAAGVRPRDDLAAGAELPVAPRGGFLVDARCRTRDPRIWAVGDCAAVEGRCYGLVNPGYRMADVVADQLLGAGRRTFTGTDMSTKLKLAGVEVASFGDAHAVTAGSYEFVQADPAAGTYAKLVLSGEGRVLLGGVLAGDTSGYATLRALIGRPLPALPEALLGRRPGLNHAR